MLWDFYIQILSIQPNIVDKIVVDKKSTLVMDRQCQVTGTLERRNMKSREIKEAETAIREGMKAGIMRTGR